MSAHLELDFNDDGTVTFTHRPAKGAELMTSVTGAPVSDDPEAMDFCGIKVAAGDDLTITHLVCIGTLARMLPAIKVSGLPEPEL